MNNCEMYQELISRLVDGELSREEATQEKILELAMAKQTAAEGRV